MESLSRRRPLGVGDHVACRTTTRLRMTSPRLKPQLEMRCASGRSDDADANAAGTRSRRVKRTFEILAVRRSSLAARQSRMQAAVCMRGMLSGAFLRQRPCTRFVPKCRRGCTPLCPDLLKKYGKLMANCLIMSAIVWSCNRTEE